MIRVGIVGCGFIGQVHSYALRCLAKTGTVDARVTAAFDTERGRAVVLAGHHDACVAPGLDALVDAVDAVWVCTWTAAHAEAVEAAAAQGRAVYCEKPLAPTLESAASVAVDLQRVPHQVGLVLRHAPVFNATVTAIQSGRYGRPLAAVFRDDQYFPVQGQYASGWRADAARAGGGTLLEHSIHDLDVLRWLLGEPEEVTARVATRFGYPGIDDTATVTLSFPDGAVATLVSVWHQVLSRPSTRRLEVFCEDALLWTDDDNLGPLHIETSTSHELVAATVPDWLLSVDLPSAWAAGVAQYAEPARAFLAALVRDGSAARGHPDAALAVAAHRLVDSAYRAAATGLPVTHPR
ncbi:MAG: Gfo/Idh/MocA family protein [Acidimicrobiia bacterium]